MTKFKYSLQILLLFLISQTFSSRLCAQSSVGIGTASPHSSAKLDVVSTTQGFKPPTMTTAQRNAIASPAAGLMIYNLTTNCVEYFNSVSWVSNCATSPPVIVPLADCNCRRLKVKDPTLLDGVYSIDRDSTGPLPAINVYCDMTTDGGGWMLVLNYNHLANTSPALNIRATNLPLLGLTTLGNDESGTTFWGHASNTMLASIQFNELRFYGITARHSRVINFKTSHAPTITYFRTGTGSCTGLGGSFTAMTGHTAFLPANAGGFDINQGDIAMTEHPFWSTMSNTWAVKALHWCSFDRWEADDIMCAVSDLSNRSTYHQIWVR